MAKYSARINGLTSSVITRLDVLDGFPTVNICIGYKVNGVETDEFPGSDSTLEICQPVYETLPGWSRPTANITCLDDLPSEALAYVLRIQELVGCPIDLISTGPHRHETILINSIL